MANHEKRPCPKQVPITHQEVAALETSCCSKLTSCRLQQQGVPGWEKGSLPSCRNFSSSPSSCLAHHCANLPSLVVSLASSFPAFTPAWHKVCASASHCATSHTLQNHDYQVNSTQPHLGNRARDTKQLACGTRCGLGQQVIREPTLWSVEPAAGEEIFLYCCHIRKSSWEETNKGIMGSYWLLLSKKG